jgi:hypothetical protein
VFISVQLKMILPIIIFLVIVIAVDAINDKNADF